MRLIALIKRFKSPPPIVLCAQNQLIFKENSVKLDFLIFYCIIIKNAGGNYG